MKPADAAFNNRAVVADWQDYLDRWAAASNDAYARIPCQRDIAYGPRPRQRLDFFPATTPGRPLITYIHGGYWQWNDKEQQAFTVAGPLGLDLNVAVIEHSLAPEVSLSEIIEELRAAMRFISAYLAQWNCDPHGIISAGTSSGAHLAACCLDMPEIRAGFLVSGCYDLTPFVETSYNDALGLDLVAAQTASPLGLGGKKPLLILCGALELPAIQDQSRLFADSLQAPHLFKAVAGLHHFSIVDDYADPKGALMSRLAGLVATL